MQNNVMTLNNVMLTLYNVEIVNIVKQFTKIYTIHNPINMTTCTATKQLNSASYCLVTVVP